MKPVVIVMAVIFVLALLSCVLRVVFVGSDLVKLDLSVTMRLPVFGLWAFVVGFGARSHLDAPLCRLVAEGPRGALLAALPLLVGSALWLADVPWCYDRSRPTGLSRAAHDAAFVVGVSCFALLVYACAPRRLCANLSARLAVLASGLVLFARSQSQSQSRSHYCTPASCSLHTSQLI